MENPFDNISARLSNIENLLLEIKHKPEEDLKPENLTVKEVSEILKVSEQSVLNYIRKGFIKAKKIGRFYLISRTDIDEALEDVKSLKYKRD